MKIQFEKLKKTFISLLPNILLALFLFFSIKTIWGSSNIMLAFIMAPYFQSIKNKKVNITKLIKDTIIFSFLGILSDLSLLNSFNAIILNFLVPFSVVLFLSDKYNPNKYISYGLVYTMFQMFPVELNKLYIRVMVFIYTFVVVFIVTYITSLKIKENPMDSTIKLGLSQAVSQFEAIYTNKNYKSSKNPLVDTEKKLSLLLYENYKNKNFISNSKDLYYHRFTITFKHINHLILHIKNSSNLDEPSKKYFFDLSYLIKNIKNDDSSEAIENFIKNNRLKDDILDKDSKYILSSLLFSIKSGDEKYKIQSIKENTKKYTFNNISFSLESTRMRFAIRLSIIMLISGIIARLFNHYIPKAYWILLNTYMMALPFYEDSRTRIFERMYGTVLGLITFYIIFHILGYTQFSVTLVSIIGITVYVMAKKYYIRTGALTSFSLFLSSALINSYELIFLRIALVLLAALLVYLGNKFIFPTGNYEELLKKLKELISLDKKISKHIYNAICESKPVDAYTLNTYLLEANMISRRIETHENSQKNYSSKDISQGFLIHNQKLLLEFAKMSKIISNSDFNIEYTDYLKEAILQIENLLTEISSVVDKYYNGYDIDSDISIIDENLYMNENLMTSIDKTYQIYDLIYKQK